MIQARQILLSFILLFGYSASACSQTDSDTDVIVAEAPEDAGDEDGVNAAKMSGEKLAALIKDLDENAVIDGSRVVFEIAERELMMVYDSTADRMRVLSPILQAETIPSEAMERMLQANFDAVLDSRYAIANNIVWSVFLHRLSSLTEDDFISGLAQTITAAETFGTAFTSGAVVFGGGDSNAIHEDLLEDLKEAAKARSDI